ncbi:MAG TPA: hypothetical protein VMI75_32265 [Polyangiaceae bacterium]|nr:hypothetical protein [Polyangiaceae bacterium]
MDPRLVEAFRFFHEHAGYVVGRRAVGALALARAELRAKEQGLTVTWDDEELPWDGDCPAPKVHVRAIVLHPDHADADTSDVAIRFPYFDRRDGSVGRTPAVLASLGGIGLDSMHDPYVRVVEAELFAEALAELDAARDAKACAMADELASRATFAAGSAVQS